MFIQLLCSNMAETGFLQSSVHCTGQALGYKVQQVSSDIHNQLATSSVFPRNCPFENLP